MKIGILFLIFSSLYGTSNTSRDLTRNMARNLASKNPNPTQKALSAAGITQSMIKSTQKILQKITGEYVELQDKNTTFALFQTKNSTSHILFTQNSTHSNNQTLFINSGSLIQLKKNLPKFALSRQLIIAENITELLPEQPPSYPPSLPPLVPTLEPTSTHINKMLIYLVSLADQPYPENVSEIKNSNFTNQINRFYLQNSYGTESFTADFIDVSIPESSSDYNKGALLYLMFTVPKSANSAAIAKNVNTSDYEWKVYSLPHSPLFTSAGVSSIGKRTIVLQTTPPHWETLAHEIGHGFNLQHAGSLVCSDPVRFIDNNTLSQCTKNEYGDPMEIMASTLPGDDNPYFKQKAGWLGGVNQPQNLHVNASGTYTLGELSLPNKDIKGLFIHRSSADPDFYGDPTFYSIEYRNANWDPQIFENLNSGLQTWAKSSKGIMVKIIDANSERSYIIPTTKAFPLKQKNVIMPEGTYPFGLQPGEVFFDSTVGEKGFRLTVDEANDTSAQVTIEID
jgi:hypothetical protein